MLLLLLSLIIVRNMTSCFSSLLLHVTEILSRNAVWIYIIVGDERGWGKRKAEVSESLIDIQSLTSMWKGGRLR